jgi:hypothetical protein
MRSVTKSWRTTAVMNMVDTWMYFAAGRTVKTSARQVYTNIALYTASQHARNDDDRAAHTSFMYRNEGECTTFGLRACRSMRHDAAMMKSAEGKMEKYSCSNWRLKSNCLRFSCRDTSFPAVKGMLKNGGAVFADGLDFSP